MNFSNRYFENRDCEYYPCHKGMDEINCLFCYCPLYRLENCPGNPEYRKKGDKTIKSCINCTFPHKKENYDKINEILKNL